MRTPTTTALFLSMLLLGSLSSPAVGQDDPAPPEAADEPAPAYSPEDQAELDRVAALVPQGARLLHSGKAADAMRLIEDVVDVRTRILGRGHPLTVTAIGHAAHGNTHPG